MILAQAQLQDYIVRLAAIPAIQGPLEYIAEVGIVQDVSHAALGQRKMSPETMLWLFLILANLALVALVVVPKAKLQVWSFFYFFLARRWFAVCRSLPCGFWVLGFLHRLSRPVSCVR
ncbi:unnamed protein product [Symbiodinium natans]|uniref:Uncharacterized protein n=1 Tax=Symbiodinium natans TaxID=878477 RepID=A0A812IFW2_9DINO|nr:unnamed protein product [Symbiodinium natans]